jgi:hypothetical protein
MTKIYLRKTLIEGNSKIEIIGENLPSNFLGMATDLKVLTLGDGAVENFSLEKAELGDAFKAQPEQFQPIFLYKSDQNVGKIVVGLSMKANTLAEVKDGVLASFYLKGDLNLAFEKPILSIYDQGRQDLQDVNWSNQNSNIPENQQNGLLDKKVEVSVGDKTDKIDSLESWAAEDLIGLVGAKTPLIWSGQGNQLEGEVDSQILWFIGFGLLFMVIVGVIIYRKRLIKLIKWPKKLISAQEKG